MAPYYQPLVTLIAAHPPPNGRLDLVLDLCREVEAEHGPAIVLATDRVVKDVEQVLAPSVPAPVAVMHETLARLLMMGEVADLERLLDWYEPETVLNLTGRERVSLLWQGLFQFVVLPAGGLAERELERQLGRLVPALRYVLLQFAAAASEEGPPMTPDPSLGELPPGSFGTATFGRPRRTAVLADGIRRLVQAWMILHQQLLDIAWRQLGSRGADRGDKLLALRQRWLAAVGQTFGEPKLRALVAPQGRLATIALPLTEPRYGGRRGNEYLDAFPPNDSRRFAFTVYDRRPGAQPPGKTIRLGDLFDERIRQLEFLLDEFGEYYPPDPPPRGLGERAEELLRKLRYTARRKLIDQVERKGASLHVESEDELVAFGCAFHKALVAAANPPGPNDRLDAWNVLLRFLDLHLRSLTTHSEFNLAESPSYFDRLFPRAWTGAALMDCGVYAVRGAFVFLSLANCLKAAPPLQPSRVSFILLPVHVGLLVELDRLPPLVQHNDGLFRMSDEQMKTARAEWDKSPEPSDPTTPSALDAKFLEDITAQLFLRDVDLPIRRVTLGSPAAPVSAPPTKAQIWRAFTGQVTAQIDRLFAPAIADPAAPSFQFDLRFLALTVLERRWHDDVVVPFWNQGCFGLWQRFAGSRRTPADAARYLDDLEALIDAADASYQAEVLPQKKRLSADFRADSRLLGPTAQRVTVSRRLEVFASSLGPVGIARAHLQAGRTKPEAIDDPPFATPAGWLSRSGD